ncbi:response regulator [Pontivivens ytuae]|uniref:Response regulator transcription factor n=1 Tax=Pontivivens ytuae TaxID=2789856 RepID=A0A7S9LVV2_9RHOB|nr:response regulator transcription factor [Pontivivens ytuae]QPH56266.1 response regulator transcription factor [Pontivivens ytuae]
MAPSPDPLLAVRDGRPPNAPAARSHPVPDGPAASEPALHVAVVDDDPDILQLVAQHLRRFGYRVTTADGAAAFRQAAGAARFDLVVLDIMMPGEDGLSLCRDIRATSDLPVILLTAMSEDTDRIVGLEMGADDYVAKPFNPRELVARIRAVLRRAQALPPMAQAPSGRVRFDGRTFDLTRRELSDGDRSVVLSEAEARLLRALVEHAGVILSRDQLLDITRGRSSDLFDRAIDTQISRLRRKVERDPADPRLILTHRGGGYSFDAEVEWT